MRVLRSTSTPSLPLGGCGGLEWEREYLRNDRYICSGKLGPSCAGEEWNYCPNWRCAAWGTWGMKNQDAILQSLASSSSCTVGSCTPVNFTIHNPVRFLAQWGNKFGVHIYGKGSDPGTIVYVSLETELTKSVNHQLFHSLYEELATGMEMPPSTKNLFIELAESVADNLQVTDCYVCGGTTMGDQWPWEAREKDYDVPFSATSEQPPERIRSEWHLKTSIIGKYCIARSGPQYRTHVGEMACLGQHFNNNTSKNTSWWSDSNVPVPDPHPFTNFTHLKGLWENLTKESNWKAPENLYWICGNKAYSELPQDWSGACVLGTLKPSFFLLPLGNREELGVSVYTGPKRKRRSSSLKIGNWKDNEWPPERIVQYYGPATWAEDGSYGYRTPIYMLNRIIRLQAVLEIITNETATALNLLAKQGTNLRAHVYQNRLALDYLLATEGGVCGKFNLSNCCLEVDNTGKVVEEITGRMKKLAHVPVQTWDGFNAGSWFGDWGFPSAYGVKAILGIVVVILVACLLLPCLIPLGTRMIQSFIEATVERKAATHIMAMWKYQPLTPQD